MSNIVTASFANGAVTTTTLTALWQYDYGQILRIEGVELPVAYEVHFCNAGDADTVTSIGDSDGVVIPDQFLQNGKTIYAYIYLHAGADDGETEYKISIPVYDRAEPTDIEPTPAQESTIGQLIDALNEGVGDAEAAVEAAWDAAAHYPYINDDGNWMVWDVENGEFVDSGVSAEGSEPAFFSYGSALYSDIVAAVEAGKVCYCVYVDENVLTWYFPLVKRENDRFMFSCSFRTSIYTAYCNTASSWSISHEDMPVRGVQMPENLGTKAAGSSYKYAREDHVHQMPSAADVGAIANPSGGSVGQVLKKTATGTEWANESGGGGGDVDSVNGQTGVVVLSASDVGALPSNTTYVSSVNGSSGSVTVTVPTKTSDLQNDSGFITSAPVTSVNNKTGAVALTASDVGAGTYSKPSGGIPKTDLASAVQTSLSKADTALQSAPVTSVNNQTGAVTISVPSASSAAPQALGTAAAGSSADYARADHVHDYGSDFVTALLQLAEKVAYIDGNGAQYYADLETALTHRTLSSISAVYTQSGTVYDTDSLDSLKTDLVVTATYSDSSTATITSYTLSGTLTAGTSTITVSYGGKATTFNVTVSQTAENISTTPVSMRAVGADDTTSWNSTTLTGTVRTKGTSNWESIVLQGLKFKFSEISTKTIRIRYTVTVTGWHEGDSGSGAFCALGLYTSDNPSANSTSVRPYNKTPEGVAKKENGTFAIDVSIAASDAFTASGIDNYYLGAAWMCNGPNTGAVATFGDIILEVY